MHAIAPNALSPLQTIYVLQEGIYLGPYTAKEVRRHWANGTIRGTDLLWEEGMSEWLTLSDYFGMPTPMVTDPLTGRIPSTVLPRPLMSTMVGEKESHLPDYVYTGHPAASAGWLIFMSWSFFGASMLAAAFFYQKPEWVGVIAGLSVIMAFVHMLRLRTGSSVGLLVAALVLPALVWCLAVSILPPLKPVVDPLSPVILSNPE